VREGRLSGGEGVSGGGLNDIGERRRGTGGGFLWNLLG